MATPNFIKAVDGNTGYAVLWTGITNGLSGDADTDLVAYTQISAPTACTATAGASGALTGAYQYKVAYITGLWPNDSSTGSPQVKGNTSGGTSSNTVNPSAQNVDLTAIPTGPTGVVVRYLYRTKANGSVFYYLDVLNDNTSTTYTDSTPDSSLTVVMPTTNTTGGHFVGDGSQLTNLPIPGAATSTTLGTVEIPASAGTPSSPIAAYRAATVQEDELTTTGATTVLSVTPSAQGNYLVSVSLRVVTAATSVEVQITWTDASGTLQTDTRFNGSVSPGPWDIPTKFLNATTASAISVVVTAGTVNQCYVTATIEGV